MLSSLLFAALLLPSVSGAGDVDRVRLGRDREWRAHGMQIRTCRSRVQARYQLG